MDIRNELHDALDEDGFPSPTLLADAIARLDEPRPVSSFRWQTLVAASLALAIVVTFFVIRVNRDVLNPVSNSPRLSSTIAGLVGYQFISPQVGWLTVFTPAGDTVITRTANGGRNWQKQLQLPGLSPTSVVRFFSDQQGVIVGQSNSATPPMVWQTTDGGLHWRSFTLPSSAGRMISAFFIDSRQGWVLTTGTYVGSVPATTAFVYQTMDAGQSWSQLGRIDAGQALIVGISFANPNTGFLLTSTLTGWAPVYATKDGGRIWSVLNLALPTDQPTPFATFMHGPTFFLDGTGLLLVDVARDTRQPCPGPSSGEPPSPPKTCHVYQPASRFLYASTDGGVSWSLSQPIAAVGSLNFVDRQRWVLLDSDSLSLTADAGKTWQPTNAVPAPPGWHGTQAQFLDGKQGWVALTDSVANGLIAVGGNGIGGTPPNFAMLVTADGGATWQVVSLPTV